MVDHYKVDTVARVQRVLLHEHPMNQVLKIRVVEMLYSDVEELEEFSDEHVNNGTKIYQILNGLVFEICVLRGG